MRHQWCHRHVPRQMRLRWAQGCAEDEPGQFGQLDAGPQGVAGQAAEAPRENDHSPGPGDQRARRHRRAREPEQEPGEDEQDGEPDRSGGAGERGEKRRAEALAGCGRANTRPDEQRGESADRRSKQQDRAPGGGRSARQGRAGNQEAQHEPERAEDADAAVAHDRQPALSIHTGEPVEAIREPVEVNASRQHLPDRHDQSGRQEGWDDGGQHAIGQHQPAAEREPDGGEPPGGAPECTRSRGLASRNRHDRQEAHGKDQRGHPPRPPDHTGP